MATHDNQPTIRAEGLVKTFGQTRALDGVDLEIPAGRVLGLLGPNGAGKTTTVRILTTLLRPDAGRAWVAGHDVLADPEAVRRDIGLSGQYAAVDENLTGYENLYMVGRFYGFSRTDARARSRELLADFRLRDAADRPAKTYSGGMRLEIVVADGAELPVAQRVLAEIGSDEPKVDAQARRVGVLVDTGPKALMEVLRRLDVDGVAVLDVALHRPTLDDVFLSLTG